MIFLKQMEHKTETHILCFGFPAQGHVSPVLQFGKRLASKGLKVTLITTHSSLTPKFLQTLTSSSSINVELISDGFNDGAKSSTSTEDYHQRYKTSASKTLAELIDKQLSSKYPPKFLVYDSHLPWALDVARRFGIDGAPFFTQPMVVNSIYYHFHKGTLKVPPEGPIVSLPSMPELQINDLPSFLQDTGSYPALTNLLVNQFSNIQEPKWIFCNTFSELEEEVVNWMGSQLPIRTIGPSIPSVYLDKRLDNDKDYGLSLFEPKSNTCLTWLDSKETGSVVYVSFGSMVGLKEKQMEELAWGLKRSNCYFLWVVRQLETEKLPSNFCQETSEKGLVVSWSPQVEVLAHKSVGCFVTHSGWNSTIEALSLGVPMVAMPEWTDQTTNAKFVADVWQVGVRVRVDEKGIVTRKEIEQCIWEIMEGERGKDIRRNSARWKELAKEAVDDGGSSDKNIEEFVSELTGS